MVVSTRISKTLAIEIAGRTLNVVNPANRALALNAALRRHGFEPAAKPPPELVDRSAIVAWLLKTYAPPE